MYAEHFGLQLPPFSNTPDPRFFYETPDHEEALASLLYVARERKGFALVTGEVGTGKTLLTRMALSRMPAGSRTAMITHTDIGGTELLRAICSEFKIAIPEHATPQSLIRLLEDFLLEQYGRDRLAIVILDEAQNLPPDAFEQLRLLGNLEAEDAKLLQVLILGQPELINVLSRNDLRQLRQRIYRNYELTGLDQRGTAKYIRHRLKVAGAPRGDIFTDDACDAVHKYARGTPRLINQICDNALLAAYSQGVQNVTGDIINEVAMHIPACFEDSRPAATAPRPVANVQYQEATAPAGSSATMAAMDHLIKRINDRQAAAESRISELTNRTQAVLEAQESSVVDAEQVKKMRQQAEQLLGEAQNYSANSRKMMGRMVEQVKRDTESLRREIANCFDDGRNRSSQFTQAIESFAGMVAEIGPDAANRMAEWMGHQQTELQALRSEIGDYRSALARQTTESEERVNNFRDGLVTGLAELAEGVMTDIASGNLEGLRDRLTEAVEGITQSIKLAQADQARAIAATQAEINAARRDLMNMRDENSNEAKATREEINRLKTELQSLLNEFNEKTDAAVTELEARTTVSKREIEKTARDATTEGLRLAQELATRLTDEREQARQLDEKLESTLARSQSRITQLTQDVESADERYQKTRREIETSTKSLRQAQREASETIEHVRSDLDSIRTDTTTAVDEAIRRVRREFMDAAVELKALSGRSAEQAHESGEEISSATGLREFIEGMRTSLHGSIHEATQSVRDLELRLATTITSSESACLKIADTGRKTIETAEERAQKIEDAARRMTGAAEAQAARIGEVAANAANSAAAARRELEQAVGEATILLNRTREEARRHLDQLQTRLSTLFAAPGDSDSDRKVTLAEATSAVDSLRESLGYLVDTAAATADSLTARISETTSATTEQLRLAETTRDEIRHNLGELVRDTRMKLDEAATELTSTFERYREQADELADRITRDVTQADTTLEARIEQAAQRRSEIDETLTGMVQRVELTLTDARERLEQTMQTADQRITDAGTRADMIAEQLTGAIDEHAERARRLIDTCGDERARLDEAVGAIEERSRLVLERTDVSCRESADKTRAILDSLTGRITELRTEAESHIVTSVERLKMATEAAQHQSDEIAERNNAFETQLLEKAENTRKQAADAIERAEQTLKSLRDRTRDAHQQLESAMVQLASRSVNIRDELTGVGDALLQRRDEIVTSLREIAEQSTGEFEALVDTARSDYEVQHERLSNLVARVEDGAADIRENASQLLSQVQEGSRELQAQTDALLEHARESAEQLGKQSASLLSDSKATAERFREQAEELIQQAEAMTQKLQDQVEEVSDKLKTDVAVMQSQVSTSIAEARAASNQSGELLAHAAQVQERTARLLELPSEIINEAGTRTQELKRMSESLRGAVTRLGQAREQSEARAKQLVDADRNADQKLVIMNEQTRKVAELIGAMRKMYNTMDSRIDQMRRRLDLAGEIATSVPQQLLGLRQALDSDERMTDELQNTGGRLGRGVNWPAATARRAPQPRTATRQPTTLGGGTTTLETATTATAAPRTQATAPATAPKTEAPKAAAPKPVAATKAPVATTPAKPAAPVTRAQPEKGSETLGQLAQKNARLNAWLRKTISDAGVDQPAAVNPTEKD